MIDPEIDHRRIVSGDAGALTGAADTLADVGHDHQLGVAIEPLGHFLGDLG